MKKLTSLFLAMLIALSTFSITALASEVPDDIFDLPETTTDAIDQVELENLLIDLSQLGFFEHLNTALSESSSEIVDVEALENLFADFLETDTDTPDMEDFENIFVMILENLPKIVNQDALENLVAEVFESYTDVVDKTALGTLYTVLFETSSDIVDEDFLENFYAQLFETAFGEGFEDGTEPAEITVDGITYVLYEDTKTACVFGFEETMTTINIPAEVDGYKVNELYAVNAPQNVTKITLPDSLEYIGAGAFEETAFYDNLENWDNGLLYIDNYLISSSHWTETDDEYSVDFQAKGDIVIKDGTRLIADCAFVENNDITSVKIPSSVKSIGFSAFEFCENLKQVEIAQGVKKIESFAFSSCTNLKSITIPSSVQGIGVDAFGCYTDKETYETQYNKDFTIYGVKDSVAQTYATDYEMNFVEKPESNSTVGDCNGDGKISVADARKIVVAIAKGDTIDLSVGDVNSDGKISVADARKLIVTIAKGENK